MKRKILNLEIFRKSDTFREEITTRRGSFKWHVSAKSMLTSALMFKCRVRKDNIKMDLREMEWGDMDRIDVAEDRGMWRAVENAIMNLRVP